MPEGRKLFAAGVKIGCVGEEKGIFASWPGSREEFVVFSRGVARSKKIQSKKAEEIQLALQNKSRGVRENCAKF